MIVGRMHRRIDLENSLTEESAGQRNNRFT